MPSGIYIRTRRWIKSGIYLIINKVNNKRYVGSAINLASRFGQHRFNLRNNKHPNRHLQSAWNKYGEDNFKFEIIERVEDLNELIEREQYWIDLYKVINPEKGYNIAPQAGSQLGYHHTEVTKAKLKGRKVSEKHREKLRLLRLGTTLPEETVQKMSDSHKGKPTWNKGVSGYTIQPKSEETKEILRQWMLERYENGYVSPVKDRKHTEKEMEQMRPTMFKKGQVPWNKGLKQGPMSQEQKEAISKGNKGKRKGIIVSEETRQKIRQAHLGKIVSPETKEKMRLSQLKYYERQKE